MIMALRGEHSTLKRGRPSAGEAPKQKKVRRSARLSQQELAHQRTPLDPASQQLPSPLTHHESTATESYRESTATPTDGRPSQFAPPPPPPPSVAASQPKHSQPQPPRRSTVSSSPDGGAPGLSSPPADTQPFSQFVLPSQSLTYDVVDEEREGVWGYLVPLDGGVGQTLVLRKRSACPMPEAKRELGRGGRDRTEDASAAAAGSYAKEEERFEDAKLKSPPSGGYLLGRHPECDRQFDSPVISNRHCLLFSENKAGAATAVLEDLSSNGTFVNEALVGRNKRRELEEGDEITILGDARFVFRYPRARASSAFHKQYRLLQQLGKGHFATVFLAVDKDSGQRFAVKRFEKRPGEGAKTEGLQQEIAVLMSVSHPNLLCLRDTFDEDDGVYLVLELAPEGELFNWIVMNQKLSEDDSRKVFIQLLQGLKYLHTRGIVHRDFKPENILLVDKDLTVKIADFGLAKIIGEESFTTTLCGTPSYVAPEILENSRHRRYTKAVDIWSLGVVLYICLCGFPPFSDELHTPDNPYTLSQQIKLARFDYPSPYWDAVGDPALDLIDRMLTVDAERRATVEECLEHPWITRQPFDMATMSVAAGNSDGIPPGLKDSAESLTGAMDRLDFSKRKAARERTLLSAINDVKLTRIIGAEGEEVGDGRAVAEGEAACENVSPVKVYEKNAANGTEQSKMAAPKANGKGKGKGKAAQKNGAAKAEARPAEQRATTEFMQLGGKGDQPLFDNEKSRYP